MVKRAICNRRTTVRFCQGPPFRNILQSVHSTLNINMPAIQCIECKTYIKKWKRDLIGLDLTTYRCKKCTYKSAYIEKTCPVCNKKFSGRKSDIGKNTTCSYSCSNTLFRSGENHGNWNKNSYRSTCFLHHNKKCIICNEDKIVTVHHYNKNHKDNDPTNLVPLCPTHHHYLHSKYSNLISDRVDEYVRNFKNNFNG
jgi:hypothetical protein